MTQIMLKDVILKHDVPVKTKYGVTHVLIFYNPEDDTTWVWKTTTLPHFEEHRTYSIIARDEGNFNISHVNEVDFDHGHAAESEQKLDTKSIDYFDKLLTFDDNYDIMSAKGGEKDV